MLIESGANVNHANLYDLTALMLAASRGQEKSIKYLLRAGAEVKCVEMLLNEGVDVNMKDIEGNTTLIFASFEGN